MSSIFLVKGSIDMLKLLEKKLNTNQFPESLMIIFPEKENTLLEPFKKVVMIDNYQIQELDTLLVEMD